MEEKRQRQRPNDRIVEQIGPQVETVDSERAQLRRERECVDDPPHGDLAQIVGMTRVGEQACAAEASSEAVDLFVSIGALRSQRLVALFGKPSVLARLKVPLLLVGERLDGEEDQKRANQGPVEPVDSRLSSDVLVCLNKPHGQCDAEQKPILKEAEEHEVKQLELKAAIRPTVALQHVFPAVVFVVGLVVAAAPSR